MKETLLLPIWMVLSVVEVLRHWFIIKTLKKSPNKVLSFVVRLVVAAVLVVFDSKPFGTSIPAYFIAGWFIHDYLLNWVLGNKFYYLNSTGLIDKLQQNSFGGAPTWFFWKAIAFIGLVGIYFFNK